MSAKKFKFVSPGVFLSEIDQSQLPKAPGAVGPVVIGRTRRGPALKPVKVNSFQEFVEVFGEPIPGNEGEDPWREGNGLLASAYAPLAAQAYLKADIDSPVTVIRLLGVEGDDASDDGAPGWDAGDAFGIFVAHSAASGHHTASLCGILYTDESSNDYKFGVKGVEFNAATSTVVDTLVSGNVAGTGTGPAVKAVNITNHSFRLLIEDSNGQIERDVSFRQGSKYIRDKINTNPVSTNSAISRPPSGSKASFFWLGETFEEEYERVNRLADGKQKFVFVMKLSSGMDDFKSSNHGLTAARSGWVIPQYNGATGSYDPTQLERLFRFVALNEGESGIDLSIRFDNIKIAETGDPSPFGRFDVVVEMRQGGRLITVESFANLNLNPNSDNFIARKIGDQYLEWDSAQKRNKLYGSYPNQSSHVRVEMNLDVGENGPTNQRSVPFGFLGPIIPNNPSISNSGTRIEFAAATAFLTGAIAIARPGAGTQLTISWPEVPHVVTGSRSPDLSSAFVMGHSPYEKILGDVSGTVNYSSVNKGMKDYLRRFGSFGTLVTEQDSGIASTYRHAYNFSLDEVIVSGTTALSNDMTNFSATSVAFVSGSHRGSNGVGRSFTALSSSSRPHLSASALLQVVDSFRMPMAGGFDGVNIVEADPFNMRVVSSTATTRNNYAYASIDRAIELVSDPEALEMNLAVMPGITNLALTKKLIQTCEARADALAIIDLPDVYIPPAQSRCTSFKDRVDNTNPAKSAKNLKARQLNSSYGAAYYPWVKVRDTINSRDIWAPPSVVALGVMGYTEQRDEVWFAPAGFNRGGLNEGNAGLPVLQASEQLLSSQRDALYEANINPIASFVSEGLVVFGQKTLQMTPSALDRINVRRLLIFVKKEVSRIANGLLFDQNLPATWNRFTGQVVPFLESVKTRLGLTDFKVVLDRTTTTADLIDRNIMYAKIFLKPARAIEFIAVDFVITRSGASFED